MLRFVNAHRVACVVLVAALVLVIVTMATRVGTEPDPADSEPMEQSNIAASPAPAAAGTRSGDSTLPPSEDPLVDQAVADDQVRLDMPVDPSGSRFDRSEGGARQSALDFVGTVQQRLLYLTNDAARDVLDAWSTDSTDPAMLDANVEELSVLRSTLMSSGGGIWWSVSPIASKVAAYDTDRARVSIWVCQVVGSSVDPTRGGESIAPTVEFRTATIDMVWTTESGWSIWATASTAGPVPMMSTASTMTSPMEFMDTLGGFTLVKEHS